MAERFPVNPDPLRVTPSDDAGRWAQVAEQAQARAIRAEALVEELAGALENFVYEYGLDPAVGESRDETFNAWRAAKLILDDLEARAKRAPE